jgi:hypothetical protein
VKDPEMRDFYVNQIEVLLKTYEPGRPNMKPDVLLQMVEIEKKRKKDMDLAIAQQKQQPLPTVSIKQGDGPPQQLTIEQIVGILQQQQAQIIHLTNLLQGKDTEIKILTEALQAKKDVEC